MEEAERLEEAERRKLELLPSVQNTMYTFGFTSFVQERKPAAYHLHDPVQAHKRQSA